MIENEFREKNIIENLGSNEGLIRFQLTCVWLPNRSLIMQKITDL